MKQPVLQRARLVELQNRVKSLQKPIALIGMMGAGKTAIGRNLAKRLQLDFIDSDKAIEESANLTISEYFAQYGELAFREGETKVIKRLVEDTPSSIISLGGGAYINEDTRYMLKENAITIWLNVPLDELWERLKHKRNRPLLKVDNPKDVLASLLSERKKTYKKADITILNEGKTKAECVNSILLSLYDYLF